MSPVSQGPRRRASGMVVILAGVSALALGACSPTLDWREVRPDGSGLTLLFPCRPGSHAREVRVGGGVLPMTLYACEAGGATFALGQIDVTEPSEVNATLAALRAAASDNLQAQASAMRAFPVPGATASDAAGRVDATGRLPGGDAGELSAVFFARGTRLFQATVLGRRLDQEAVETYFSGLKLSG